MSEVNKGGKSISVRRLLVMIFAVVFLGVCVIPYQYAFANEEQPPEDQAEAEEELPAPIVEVVPPQVEIEPAAPPVAPPVNIKPERPPLAETGTWAVLNLILTIATCLIMLLLLVAYFRKRKGKEARKHPGLSLLTLAAAVVAVILFIRTENMGLLMGIADSWTLWHAGITVAALVLAIFSRNKHEDKDADAYSAAGI